MNLEQQLKLQSYLDGELTDRERRAVAQWLERDAGARALLGELEVTHQVLAGNEPAAAVPETREFYWSKIAREIEKTEPRPARAGGSLLSWLRRLLVPAAGFAVLLLALAVIIPRQPGGAELETNLTDNGAMTYRDHANGVTLVWLSYPAENTETDYELPPATSGE